MNCGSLWLKMVNDPMIKSCGLSPQRSPQHPQEKSPFSRWFVTTIPRWHALFFKRFPHRVPKLTANNIDGCSFLTASICYLKIRHQGENAPFKSGEVVIGGSWFVRWPAARKNQCGWYPTRFPAGQGLCNTIIATQDQQCVILFVGRHSATIHFEAFH